MSSGGQARQVTNAALREPNYNRDKTLEAYEADLKEARRWARTIGVLHSVSKFLTFCNLTWATVALLGAFLPDLAPLDFGFVTSLLFIEAGRLASAPFFLRWLMRPLAYGSQNPQKIKHGGDEQYPASDRLRCTSHLVQCVLIAPGFVLPIVGHICLRSYSDVLNLNASLRIFYSFVSFNSFVALINLICYMNAFRVIYKQGSEQSMSDPETLERSILRYFDTVLERAISFGNHIGADDFEFFRFAYTLLGAEFRRQVVPMFVAKRHKRLIQYLYAHRLGVDALMTFLEAEDPFVQLAAVNMVGFWCDRAWGVGLPETEQRSLPEKLLTKLADMVGTGQLGWAAAVSFGTMAEASTGAQIMAETRTSSGVGLLDRLVSLVDEFSDRSLSLVRTLVRFYEQYCVNKKQPPRFCEQEEELERKLERLARESKVHRLRVRAAYLLLLMDKRSAAYRGLVLAIKPDQDDYWYASEQQMLELLRSLCDAPPLEFPQYRRGKSEAFVRQDAGILAPRPPWVGL